jgi:23S rRNA pseudouridine2605 synthase
VNERLQKLLARHDLGSRREIERWMVEGRVLLNGRPATPGDKYNHGDRVVLDGRDVTSRLHIEATSQVLIYHKPQGQPWSAPDEAVGETVLHRLPSTRGARWLSVNRLHEDDSGLLLVTNDGKLADVLMRQAQSIPSVYSVRVRAPTRIEEWPEMPLQVQFEEQTFEFTKVEEAGGEGSNRWYRVESARSDKRAAVRALFEASGLEVSRAIQLEYAQIELPRDLPRGRHRALTAEQIAALYESAGVKPVVPRVAPRPVRKGRPRNLSGPRTGGPRKGTGGRHGGARANDSEERVTTEKPRGRGSARRPEQRTADAPEPASHDVRGRNKPSRSTATRTTSARKKSRR